MNVFIIALTRSGSFNLTNAFRAMYGGTPYREPFNKTLDKAGVNTTLQKDRKQFRDTLKLDDKWVLKTIADQISMEDAVHLHKEADLTIVLGRRSKEKRLESFSYAAENMGFSWHQRYTVENQEIPDYIREMAERQEIMLGLFSEVLQVPITYYEDLYFDMNFKTNFAKQFGEKAIKFISLLDPSKKYRKENGII